MNTTHPESLVGAYVANALSTQERRDFEAHLDGCSDCREEVESLRETTASMAVLTATTPPPRLRGAVLDAISQVRPLPPLAQEEAAVGAPVVATSEDTERSAEADLNASNDGGSGSATVMAFRSPRTRIVAALTAAAAVIIAIGFAVANQSDDAAQQAPPVSVAEAVLGDSEAERTTLKFGKASATVVRSASEARAVIVTKKMPPPPDGKVYQLWFDLPGQGMVSAGLMPIKKNQTVVLKGDASQATAAGITVEPAGGSAEPSGDPIAVFPFTAA